VADYSVKRFNKYSDQELFVIVQSMAKDRETQFVTSRDFEASSGISPATIQRRFGTWREFCLAAGLQPSYTRTENRHDLFTNLEVVWESLGRQPRSKEMKKPLSAISGSRYLKEFGSWYAACLEFLAWRSGLSIEQLEIESRPTIAQPSDRPSRAISLALRYEILKRDNFKCTKCGRSPASDTSVQLHIDHVLPYSLDGTTSEDNLQTLCSDCNLGKGNRHIG